MVYGSIYGAARTGVTEGAFNPDYATPDAPLNMVVESLEVEQKFFDLFVEHDFLEVAAANDSVLESTLISIDESFVSDAWEKIKAFLKKIKDKLVSICKAAAVKIGAFFTKDNAALISKYEKQFNAADFTKIEIKGYRTKKADASSITSKIEIWKDFSSLENKSESDLKKVEKEVTVDKTLKTIATGSDSFDKNVINALFNKEKDVKASEIASAVKETLSSSEQSIKDIDTVRKDLEDQISKMEETADNMSKDAMGGSTTDQEYKDKELAQKRASIAHTYCTVMNTVVAKTCNAVTSAVKFNIKQARAAYIKIASKGSPNVKNESAELLEAMLDADAYEVDSFFEQYSYDYEELTA